MNPFIRFLERRQPSRQRVWWLAITVLGFGWSWEYTTAAAERPRILFFTQTSGYEHSVIRRTAGNLSFAEQVWEKIGAEHGVDFVFSKDGSLFNPTYLAGFDAFVFYTNGNLTSQTRDGSPSMTPAGKAALLDAIAAGKGFVGLHSAAATFRGSASGPVDPFLRMLGGEFVKHGRQQSAKLTVPNPRFPGFETLPAGYGPIDEWYTFRHFSPDLHVLLSLDPIGMVGEVYDRPSFPVAWARLHGAGRVYYTGLGHREDVWLSSEFQAMMWGALSWVLQQVQAEIPPTLSVVTPNANRTGPVPPLAFFERGYPFFHTQVKVFGSSSPSDTSNFVTRGILLPLANGYCAVFDQELLRMAGFWKIGSNLPPVTPKTVAQESYIVAHSKAANHPEPTGPLLLWTGMHRGIAPSVEQLMSDPRPPGAFRDHGRGALPADLARFEGVELAGDVPVLHYRVEDCAVREWTEASSSGDSLRWLRHFEISAHHAPLCIAVGTVGENTWKILHPQAASGISNIHGETRVETNSSDFVLTESHGELIATLGPSTAGLRRVTLALSVRASAVGLPDPTPPRPKADLRRRWPESVEVNVTLATVDKNGLILDRIAIPDDNPWNRRVRSADLAFLDNNRAAVLTYDGDVWMVDGLSDPLLNRVTWRRYASGLHESLAIVAIDGVLQVATKNGIVRLHDRDGNGEADWYENFNDHIIQSQSTRSFPLDMALASDGSTFVTQGGIRSALGITFDEHRPQTGSILKISPDGRSSEVFAMGAREPFLTVDPKSGVVTATDQQGHFIPSSVCYLVKPGDEFGFLQPEPAKLTPPLVWIPHDQDNSSASQVWIRGTGMGPWSGRLLHLSYGNSRLLLISPDLDAPTPQGAVVPLDIKTDLPLLHARMHPRGDSVFLAGFQIWGTLTKTSSSLARLRVGDSRIETPMAARSIAGGVILEFAAPLNPSSLTPESVTVRAWNYRRTPAYGSGRFALDGTDGTTRLGVAQVVPSKDARSVFIHIPDLSTVMQLEVRYDFRLLGDSAARGSTYFTIHSPRTFDLGKAGFPSIDFAKIAAPIKVPREPAPTSARGREVAEAKGCFVCHSTDGSTVGKIGPTWRDLFGSERFTFAGKKEVADAAYLRARILDPQEKRSKREMIEMPSYRGVLDEHEIDAVIRYLRSLSK